MASTIGAADEDIEFIGSHAMVSMQAYNWGFAGQRLKTLCARTEDFGGK
jgi:hypothetical protein